VFIAGAHTYLGARVASVFQERDYDVVCLAHENQATFGLEAIGVEIVRGSLLEPEGWKNVLKRCEFALNLHRRIDWSGEQPGRGRGKQSEEEAYQVRLLRAINVEGVENFLDTCITLDVPKVLTLSAALALGDHRGTAVDETSDHMGNFRSHYEKSMYDSLFKTRVRIEEGARVACMLPGPILGPRAEGPFTHIVENYVTGKLPWAIEGRSSMTFTYIDDIVRAIFQILDRRAPTGLYIIGNDPVTWQDFFKMLEKVSGISPKQGWKRESAVEGALHPSRLFGRRKDWEPPIPPEILPYLVDCQYKFSSARAKREFGWDDTPMETWMAELVQDIRYSAEGPATQAAIETFMRPAAPR
jgi:nucleoside-diphosphate-sugar epimerase